MRAGNTTAGGVARLVGGREGPLRHGLVLLVIAIVLIAAPTIALARATDSHAASVKRCGAVHHDVAVTTQGGVTCQTGRKVANAWLAGNKQPSGFTCKKIKVNAGSGFQGVCTNKSNKSKRVRIIPE